MEREDKTQQGLVGDAELKAALQLDPKLRAKISEYEQGTWAANLSTPVIQSDWRIFLSKLEKALSTKTLDDNLLIEVVEHISTMDTVSLLDQVGKLNPERQTRFLHLLNWVAENDEAAPSAKKNANIIRERILMAYRLKQYPQVYSTQRLDRAIRLASQNT